MINFRKILKEEYPEIDMNQYLFKDGDIVTLNNHAKVLVLKNGVIEYDCLVLKSGFGMKKGDLLKVKLDMFPYFNIGEFVSEEPNISKSLKWEPGDIVIDPEYNNILAIKKPSDNGFLAFVLETDYPFYYHTSIYKYNPYEDYIVK